MTRDLMTVPENQLNGSMQVQLSVSAQANSVRFMHYLHCGWLTGVITV